MLIYEIIKSYLGNELTELIADPRSFVHLKGTIFEKHYPMLVTPAKYTLKFKNEKIGRIVLEFIMRNNVS